MSRGGDGAGAWVEAFRARLADEAFDDAAGLLDDPPAEISDDEQQRARAALALAQGDWAGCVAILRALVRRDPEGAPAIDWQNLAAALVIGEQWPLARDAAIRAVHLDPRLLGGWIALCHAERALDLPADGAVLAQAVTLHPDAADLAQAMRPRLPAVRRHAGILADALRDVGWDVLLIDWAEETPALARHGLESATRIDDRAAALRLAERLLADDPQHPLARAALTEIMVQDGRYDAAMALGTPLLDGAPRFVTDLVVFALVAAEAIGADEILTLSQDTPGRAAQRDGLARDLGLAGTPEAPLARAALALLRSALDFGRWRTAMAVTDTLAGALAPDARARLWVALGHLLDARERPVEALAAFAVAQRLDPQAVPDGAFAPDPVDEVT